MVGIGNLEKDSWDGLGELEGRGASLVLLGQGSVCRESTVRKLLTPAPLATAPPPLLPPQAQISLPPLFSPPPSRMLGLLKTVLFEGGIFTQRLQHSHS